MKRTAVARLCLAACAVLGAGALQAQTAPHRGRVVTMTRQVAAFFDHESQAFTAIQHKDTGTLDRLLSQEFQVWTPQPPGDPVPREDWLKQALAEDLKSFSLLQMAAVAVDNNNTLVSFVLSEVLEIRGKPVSRNYFVVDLWSNTGDSWQVTNRYVSKVAGMRGFEAKPSGKN